MVTKLTCNNCGESNPVYSLNCSKCNSFLRARVPNIDMWDTIWNILVTPTETLIKIIQAEKKNYIGFLLSIWFIKSTINYFITSNYMMSETTLTDSIIKGGLISVSLVFIIPLITSKIFTAFKIQVRYKDLLANYTYSLIPIILAFVFLTPFHFALYGFYWYTINPSPLIIKPLVSYVMYGIEGLFYFWVLLLLVTSTYVQIGSNKLVSILIGIIVFLVLFGYHFLIV